MDIMIVGFIGWGIWFVSYIIYKIWSKDKSKNKVQYMTVTRSLKKIKKFEKGFNDSCNIKINK
ncbi:hypothetical protein [Clostridium sp. CTA-6]|nr:hypothetical protein [Clostridium botulinum]EKS4395897.1 hypothetical protein [Clostridium botulinum]